MDNRKPDYPTIDDREITPEEWRAYDEAIKAWSEREYSDEMSRAMSKPNPPNYKFANND